MNIEWKRRLTILGIVAGVIAGYRYLLPVAVPFLAAWFLASWLYPVTLKLEKRTRVKKSLWGAILLALLLAAAGGILYWGIRELFGQLKAVVANFPAVMKWGMTMLDGCCGLLEEATGIAKMDSRSYILERLAGMQEQFLAALSPGTVMKALSVAKGVLVFFSAAVVTFITAIMMLSDMENIRRKIWDYSWLVGLRRVGGRLKKTVIAYLKAQIILILVVGAVCTVGFWMMGSPYFLILGMVLGVLDALPILGTGTFLYPAALFFLIKKNAAVALGCVLLDVITSILREFLEPRLLGNKMGISPIVVLASVYIGIFLYGGWGFFVGPLSFSTIYEIGRQWDIWD